MARVSGGKTYAVHADCADRPVAKPDPWTWRQSLERWGLESLRRLGYRVPELDTTR